MALHPLMRNALPRAVLGAALLSVTATVYAAGSWFSDASSCTSGPPNVFYIGVCKSGTGEVASGAKVAFDITTGTADDFVYGGYSWLGEATGNSVTVSGGSINSNVYGGVSGGSGNATGNSVTVLSGGSITGDVFGSYSLNSTTDNTVTVSGGSIAGYVYGSYSLNSNATDNTVTVSGGSIAGYVYGSYSNGNASDNTVTVSGGSITGNVLGGSSRVGNATGNTVTVSGGSITQDVYGGDAAGNATGNAVAVSGGSINSNVYGGAAVGNATGNTVTVLGGSVAGVVFGGFSVAGGSTTGNRVILAGSPVFGANTVIYGGNNPGTVTGNVLEVRTKGLEAKNVGNFEQYSFLLPTDTQAGDTVLTLTDTAGTNLTNAKVGVAMQSGGDLLKKGDKVALIHNGSPAGVISTGVKQVSLTGYKGISLEYTFGLASDANTLYAVTESDPQVREQTKAPVEGRASSMAFSLQGADLAAGAGMNNAVGAGGAGGAGGIHAFGAMSGGTSRYNTGSHVDVDGTSLLLGVAKQVAMNAGGAGNLTLGAFFEGGWGNYDSYNDFDSGEVHGSGSADYVGGGVLARQDWASGLYAEGSVRGGRMRSDWSSADMGVPNASYDTSTPYYGAHLGVGMVWPLNPRTSVDVSAKYFWTHQDSDDADIAGDPYHFESMDSQRTRLGVRVTYAFTDHVKGYAGAAWDHEYDGVARATVYGLDTPSPSLQGDTGVFEVGVSIKPEAARALTVALGVQGYVGQREGVGGTLKMGWAF